MLIWGGYGFFHETDVGATYNPASDTWAPLSTDGAPSRRFGHTAVWTGSEMIVWGGTTNNYTLFGDGARYNPATNAWTALPTTGAPSPRHSHTAVWTGSEMIVWGAGDGSGTGGDGARFNPATNSWSPLESAGEPVRRFRHTAIWTGSEMIIWGGENNISPWLADGARYNPATNAWTALPSTSAPTARMGHTAIWTGTEMLIWGGWNGSIELSDGAGYTPPSTAKQADLAITKADSPDPVQVGQNLTYTIDIKNNGPDDATGVILTDPLHANAAFQSITKPASWSCTTPAVGSTGTVTCNAGTQANGDSARITIVVKPSAAGQLDNTASVKANEADLNQINNKTPAVSTRVDPSTTPRKVIVFLEGIGTDLTPNEIDMLKGPCSDPSNDQAFGEIKEALQTYGFVCGDFLRYSYTGGSMNGKSWIPDAYDIEDTGQSISLSLNVLKVMIGNYRKENPNTEFILLGHSLGGVVAFETAKLVGGDALLPQGSITTVIAIDSPLVHASKQTLVDIKRIAPAAQLDSRGQVFFYSKVAKELGDVTDSNRQKIRNRQEAGLARAQARGVRFMTIGNDQDCVWYLTLCGLTRTPPHGKALSGDWIDDRTSMLLQNADRKKRYPLGTQGCDLSGGGFVSRLACIADPHAAALDDSGTISDITQFVGNNY